MGARPGAGVVTTEPVDTGRRVRLGANAILALLAAVKLAAHLAVAGNYGYFRDELYYIAAGRHLAFGYVEFPPLIALLAALVRVTVGESLVALHVVPALAGTALVVVTGLIARALGGGAFAQGLAALGALVATVMLAMGSLFSMDPFDQLWWALAAYVLVRLIKEERPRLWLLFGLVAGIGLATKVTIAAFGFAVAVGLLLTPARRLLFTRWLWLGGLVAFAFALPYIIWNAVNGWPTIEFWGNYGGKLTESSPVGFLLEQVLTMNPVTLPLWLAGLAFFLRAPQGRPYRALGLAFLILLVLFALTGAKPYFLAPAYPMLLAGGAVAIEQATRRGAVRSIRVAYPALLLLSGVLTAPIALPILAPDTWVRYYGFVTGATAQEQVHEGGALPQWLGDRFGWEAMVETVAGVYQGLPVEERARACIFTANYGEAGAIDFFGPAHGLPRAISGHNTYYLWGPGDCTGEVVISVGYTPAELDAIFDDVTQAATVTCEVCMPEEANVPILVARGLRQPMDQIWPQAKHFN